MIVVELAGGLASQLHKYAVARALADTLGQDLKLDVRAYSKRSNNNGGRAYGLDKFNIRAGIASNYDILQSRGYVEPIAMYLTKLAQKFYVKGDFSKIQVVIKEKFNKSYYRADITTGATVTFFNKLKLIEKENLYLCGEWGMGTAFFDENRNRILNDLTPCYPLSQNAQNFLALIEAQDTVACHIRRGDYVGNNFHNLCDEAYYVNGINHVLARKPGLQLAIFTDDPVWACDHFVKLLGQTPLVIRGCDIWEDFYLLSRCQHFVLSASGFSSLASWLSDGAGKIVVSPKIWFSDKDINRAQLSQLPTDWIYL